MYESEICGVPLEVLQEKLGSDPQLLFFGVEFLESDLIGTQSWEWS